MGKIVKNGVSYTVGAGLTSYAELSDKPSINNVSLAGNKTAAQLGLATTNDIPTVSVTQVVSSGTKIATVTVDSTSTDIYAPEGGSGSGGHTIENASGTELTQRDTMQFGAGLSATDDSTNEKTVIAPDTMTSSDMEDVITPVPGPMPTREGIKYSTTEQVVGEWIDSKPIYQKTMPFTFVSGVNKTLVDSTLTRSYVDMIVSISGGFIQADGNKQAIPRSPISSFNSFSFFVDADGLQGSKTDNSALGSGYVTLQYTKATS